MSNSVGGDSNSDRMGTPTFSPGTSPLTVGRAAAAASPPATLLAGPQAIPPLPPPQSEAPNEDETDALFADELNRLTIKERDEVLNDVHGVADVITETPEMVQRAIQEMATSIESIPATEKIAYEMALLQNKDYVTNHKFWLMFLRAEEFQPQEAAVRLVAFFQTKLELFGADALARDVSIDQDLDDDDLRCLESGYAQVCDSRDRAGRAVFILLPTIRKYKSVENRLRAIYMTLMFALHDEETQKRGLVGIAYNVGRDHTKDREAVWKAAKIVSILPIRFTAVHYCFDDEKIRLLFSLAMFVFNKNARIRCRFHYGTHMECIYKLMTFGIPGDTLPISPNGGKKIEPHLEYIQTMRRAETLQDDGYQRIILPGKYDVLLGRGKPLQKHPGNLNYHCVVERYHDEYERALKLEKTKLASKIVAEIHQMGGAFLKQDTVGWIAIDEDAARTKISHTFRNHRIAVRTAIKKQQQQQQQAATIGAPMAESNGLFGGGSVLGERFSPGMVLDPTVESKRRRISGFSAQM